MLKKINLFVLCLFLFQCSSTSRRASAEYIVKTQDITIEPGMVEYVTFNMPRDMKVPVLKCRDKVIAYYENNGIGHAYLVESYFSNMKPFDCYLSEGNYKEQVFRVKVQPFPYKSEKLKVDRKKVVLSQKDLKRVIKESKMLKDVYAESVRRPLFDGPFKAPLNSYITSEYGTRRVYNNVKKGQHLGVDFRAAVGVPIPNTNRGKVVFAGDLFYTGNTVIIDHGMNIFTVYAHLSEIAVQESYIADIGDIIGKAGMTGRVSGPHLHWGVKVQGENVSGFSLVEASKKQFRQ